MTSQSYEARALLTEAATARLLSMSMRTLQAWRLKGIGPSFVRVGRAIRYRHDVLFEWIDANTDCPNNKKKRES